MSDSIFTKIIKGEIPCHKIYEDDKTIAFLDIAPYSYGHTLVVIKNQTDQLWDVEDTDYEHLMKVVKKVADRLRKVLRPERVGLVVEGFAVAHAHVHVFPMEEGLEATIERELAKPSDAELTEMAKRLAF